MRRAAFQSDRNGFHDRDIYPGSTIPTSVDYFLVFGICLALTASFFFWLAAAALACFCAACLLVAFGDLSPIPNAKAQKDIGQGFG
jgi:hypothetical protein